MTKEYIADLIVAKAMMFKNVREHGYNKGQDVEMFQRAVDGKASSESWCMCFVQYIAKDICGQVGALYTTTVNHLYPSEGCLDIWNHTPNYSKNQIGGRGMIAIWEHGNTGKGHTGFCQDAGKVYFHTIEGNTNLAGSREGDGVYEKTRSMITTPGFKLKGFIDLPQMIYDMLPLDKKSV